MNKSLPLLLLLLLPAPGPLDAQTLSGISTRWSNSFVAWDLLVLTPDASADEDDPEEETYGSLQIRWINLRDDFSEWDYELGTEKGTIRQKWANDPTQWELRSYSGDVVTMRAMWPNDLTQWRVTDNSISLVLKPRWTNAFDEWLVEDQAHGVFYVYTLQRGDPRDWAVDDRLDTTVSQPLKLALLFLAVFQSSPKM